MGRKTSGITRCSASPRFADGRTQSASTSWTSSSRSRIVNLQSLLRGSCKKIPTNFLFPYWNYFPIVILIMRTTLTRLGILQEANLLSMISKEKNFFSSTIWVISIVYEWMNIAVLWKVSIIVSTDWHHWKIARHPRTDLEHFDTLLWILRLCMRNLITSTRQILIFKSLELQILFSKT